MIPSTRPYLPPLERYQRMVAEIWDRRWLTNHGYFLQSFETRIAKYFDLPHATVVNSGTTGLLMALESLPAGSEIITTPFSYVATTSSITWQGLKPVFADIEPDALTLDPEEVRKKITPRTTAVLATHVFGNPCDVEALEALAQEANLTLIFDAAHCFGTEYGGQSVLKRGDVSILSFHATKVFHTIGGGMITAKSQEVKESMDRKRNFGHVGQNDFKGRGINGKMDEFQAAMGLLNLEVADELVAKRRAQWMYYRDGLKDTFDLMTLRDEQGYNGAYFPVFLPPHLPAEEVKSRAMERGMELRRYFYPSLNTLGFSETCPIAEDRAKRVLCLPMFHDMETREQDAVMDFLRNQ